MAPVISVSHLSKKFGARIAVQDVSLTINPGEIVGFLGPNGSGKTTTIRMLCGLLTPDRGNGTCLGFDIRTQSDLIKPRIGYMTQQFSLYNDLTIEENLDFYARLYDIPNRVETIEKTLKELNLMERRQQITGTLSGGWKQRLALSCVLLHDPEILLLDEPTAGVDPKARREFWTHVTRLASHGKTVLVSTHYMDEAERCTQLAFFNNGVLLARGTASEIIQQSGLHNPTLEEAFVELLS